MQEAILEPLLRRMRFRQVISHIPPNSTVLDIGCGRTAAFLKTISPRIHKGIGIDFKVDAIETDRIKTIPTMLYQELPFAEDSFDVVTMLAVLEHIEHEKYILKEIHRVLKPQGKLILTVPSVWSQPILEFLSYRLKIVDEAEIRDHKRYYKRQTLWQTLVEEVQFRNFEHHYFQLGMNNFCTVTK